MSNATPDTDAALASVDQALAEYYFAIAMESVRDLIAYGERDDGMSNHAARYIADEDERQERGGVRRELREQDRARRLLTALGPEESGAPHEVSMRPARQKARCVVAVADELRRSYLNADDALQSYAVDCFQRLAAEHGYVPDWSTLRLEDQMPQHLSSGLVQWSFVYSVEAVAREVYGLPPEIPEGERTPWPLG